ncbi:MAG: hypothetical protein ACK5JN_21385 [Kluyvera sp.]|uniref:hypothetical protein n=1 Tax=Kluyvera sp. TaxID=1538228 RepID=UPI003A86A29B
MNTELTQKVLLTNAASMPLTDGLFFMQMWLVLRQGIHRDKEVASSFCIGADDKGNDNDYQL